MHDSLGCYADSSMAGREECALVAYLHMRKQTTKLFVLVGLLIGIMLMAACTVVATSGDPLTYDMTLTPPAISSPGSIRVSISIMNSGDDAAPITVTLYDPDNKVCAEFGSGGTATLSPGSSQTYTGTWYVTQEQLDAKRVTYNARYTIQGADGNSISTSRPLSEPISQSATNPQLQIERKIEPGPLVNQGDTVTISYTIKNTGSVDVMNITIADPGIIDEAVVHESLPAGESTVMQYSYTADATSKTTHAEITYQFKSGSETKTSKPVMADPASTIEADSPQLIVELSADRIVSKGDKVDLKYTITNKSEGTIEKIKITDKILNDIDSNLTLQAGKSIEGTHPITVNDSQTYQFTVTGVDAEGNDVEYQSNQLTIQTAESAALAAGDLSLDLKIEADRDVIYYEPTEVLFKVLLTNNGDTSAQNIVLYARDVALKTIDIIDPTETLEFIIPVNVSMAGIFQFEARMAGATQTSQTAKSNEYSIQYMMPPATPSPTPAPTLAPTPEPTVDPNATEDPGFGGQTQTSTSLGSILVYVLGGLLIVIVLAVLGLMYVDRRRKAGAGGGSSGSAKVIDTFERAGQRDYMRAPKRGAERKKKAAPAQTEETVDARIQHTEQDGVPLYDGDLPDMPEPEAVQADAEEVETGPIEALRHEPKAAEEAPADPFRRPADAPARSVRSPWAAPVAEEKHDLDKQEPVIEAGDDGSEDEDMSAPQAPAAKPAPKVDPEAMGDTTVYGKEYLSRIRGEKAKVVETDDEPDKTVMSDEDAALLSGSTGQYRLSRKTTSVRSREDAFGKAEDADTFSRRQRAQRAQKQTKQPKQTKKPADFYDDDDEGDDTPLG